MINLLKSVGYRFSKKGQLKSYKIKLGYIFHTEKIYNDAIFDKLILFCKEYNKLTGAKPICTVIPPTNLALQMEMIENNFSEREFVNRIHELSKLSTIGYHGHFYLNNDVKYYNAIHCNNFNNIDLTRQFNNDINWFKSNEISHNNIYAGGWWFINQKLIKLLLEHHFKFDFSFSRAKFFYNQESNKIMNEHHIKTGEVFNLCFNDDERKLTCIQNFIGMHTTRFPEDFDRNMKKIIGKNGKSIGVVNAHDYDLEFDNTLHCIKYQININKLEFCSFEDLITESPTTTIKLQ